MSRLARIIEGDPDQHHLHGGSARPGDPPILVDPVMEYA